VTYDPPLIAVGRVLWAIPKHLINFASGDTPSKLVAMMEDSKSSDQRRKGILELASEYRFARHEPYTKRYSQIAGRDEQSSVRAAALRALNHSRSKLGDAAFVASLDDADALVRLEAAKGLANVPVEAAIPKLIEHVQKDESKDVRIACADALRNFKTLDVARALAGVLGDRDFGVSWQARKSLNLMTGRDFRYDEGAWLDYVSKATKPFV
jgi:HEAT repeat protein